MKTKYILLFFNFFALYLSAQPENAHWNGQNVVQGKTYVTYGDNVSLRATDNVDADKLANLPVNTSVTILEVLDKTHSVYGTEAPWLKVRAGDQTGFLVSGFLALRSIELGDGSKLLYTRTQVHDEYSYQIKMRRVFKDRFVELGTYDLGIGNFAVELHNSKGLKNIDHVLKIDFLAEACGENGGRSYFAIDLNEDMLLDLGSYPSVGDGGMFHHSEDLIFPDEPNGMPGMIIYIGEQGSENEVTAEYRTVTKRKEYSWSDISGGKKIEPFNYD
ncbi:MAG: hypothetical protein WBG46_01985 [Nonlabens sp.]